MRLLNGHPLAMRVILPRLENRPAAELTEALWRNFNALRSGAADESEARLFATLRFATDALPAAWQPLLIALAQHEGYVVADLLEEMARQVDAGWTRAPIDDCLGALASGGLLRGVGSGIWEMHPAVSGFLRSALGGDLDPALRDAWVRAFVDVMGSLANALAPRPLHEQRRPFHLVGASLHSARASAQRLGMSTDCAAPPRAWRWSSIGWPTAAGPTTSTGWCRSTSPGCRTTRSTASPCATRNT
ncbi:MAG TPA: hypothetical protein VKA46_43295, partial [Gemmataceae bacterium]|nr:hypothetical protein [Gemmataceae bacterium]